ncbi:hypothetical protein FRC07_003443 [Ceratobasidium sp. 392]|nr:hypothetical protein FRC07_003443 [Ceratobasidium sp. 392]
MSILGEHLLSATTESRVVQLIGVRELKVNGWTVESREQEAGKERAVGGSTRDQTPLEQREEKSRAAERVYATDLPLVTQMCSVLHLVPPSAQSPHSAWIPTAYPLRQPRKRSAKPRDPTVKVEELELGLVGSIPVSARSGVCLFNLNRAGIDEITFRDLPTKALIMKAVLVIGSTGQQGSSVVRTLSQSRRYFCLALTRNPETPKAKRIASLENVRLVSADFGNEYQLRDVFTKAEHSEFGPIWGVFVALAYPGLGVDATEEEVQGKNIASIAAEFGVQSYIYSSTIKYFPDEQYAPAPGSDRYAKMLIEKHVQTFDYSWTIIRPGFFMENLSPDIIGRITDGALRYSGNRVQLVTVEDIGPVSCAIFDDPSNFKHKILDVAGDSLTSDERSQAFIRATGHDIPGVPSLLIATLHGINGNVRQIIKELRLADETRRQDPNGHDANLREVAEHVKLTKFEEWVRKRHSGTEENANKNGVTLWGLILGR